MKVIDGTRKDHDRLAQLLKQHFSIALESKEISVKGWNWGTTDFQGTWPRNEDIVFILIVIFRTRLGIPCIK